MSPRARSKFGGPSYEWDNYGSPLDRAMGMSDQVCERLLRIGQYSGFTAVKPYLALEPVKFVV